MAVDVHPLKTRTSIEKKAGSELKKADVVPLMRHLKMAREASNECVDNELKKAADVLQSKKKTR